MFYIKTKRGHKIPIEDGEGGNVFTQCPECGKEQCVDLTHLISFGEVDLYSTVMYCHECSVERAKKDLTHP